MHFELPREELFNIVLHNSLSTLKHILVPRGRASFGQHQESRPLARSNTGSPRFTDFPSLCACSELSLTNMIGSVLNLLFLQIHSKPACSELSLTNLIGSVLNLLCYKSIQNRNVIGPYQRSRFLVLTKRSAASGDENVQSSASSPQRKQCWYREFTARSNLLLHKM